VIFLETKVLVNRRFFQQLQSNHRTSLIYEDFYEECQQLTQNELKMLEDILSLEL
jgi:hypothetical protein